MYIIFDVGATNIKYSVVGENFEVLKSSKVKTPKHNLEEFRNALFNIIDENGGESDLNGIGICVPGQVDIETKMIIDGGTLTFLNNQSVVEILPIKNEIPIILENDAKSAALGELWRGHLKDVQNGMVLTLGTGLGGGIVLNGGLYRGTNNESGEISFLNVYQGTGSYKRVPVAYQGSAVMMVDKLKKYLGDPDLHGVDAFRIMEESQDPYMLKIFNDYILDISNLLIDMQCIFDFEKILIGGGISSQDIVINALQETVKKLIDQNDWLRNYPVVEKTKFGNAANQMGLIYELDKENGK